MYPHDGKIFGLPLDSAAKNQRVNMIATENAYIEIRKHAWRQEEYGTTWESSGTGDRTTNGI